MSAVQKTILITGATSGIGRVTAGALASQGATVIITSRDEVKGSLVADQIIHATGNNRVFMMPCDLSDLSSVRRFAADFLNRYDRLDVLINNAGTWEMKRKTSIEGYEMNMATNHLGPFLLTNLLLDLLKKSAPARIINVASSAHKNARIDFRDIQLEKSFNWFKGYAQSKLMNILFTKNLDKKLRGSGITVNCLHPGIVRTSIFRNMSGFNRFVIPFMSITAEKGAETTIYLATSDNISNISGAYFAKKKVTASSAISNDTETADKLWAISEKLTGLVETR